MSDVDYIALKQAGFMKQIQKDRFSLRLRIVGGQVGAEQLKKLYEIAENYGQGYIHLTARQSIEIPFLKLTDIELVKRELALAGLEPGVCGPRFRTITACQGSAVCPHGLIDTTALAKKYDQMYFATVFPHKIKLGITGCGNNCLKAEENDLGIKGGMKPKWIKDACNFCGLCEAVCPTQAIEVDKQNGSLLFDEQKCNFCGKCITPCPGEAWQGERGFIVYFGGFFGKRIATGKRLLPILFSEEELDKAVAAGLEFFRQHGKPGERFKDTLDRIGWNHLQEDLEQIL
jgi:anaerobic sulfite reductase subunit C